MPHDRDIETPPPERPRFEPEIIPPGQASDAGRGSYARPDPYAWASGDEHVRSRIYVMRPGPFGTFAALILGGLLLAAIVLVIFGLVLFWIPLVVALVAGLLLSGYIRYRWRRLRAWARSR